MGVDEDCVDVIIRLAAEHRLPVVYPGRHYITDGGLMSYGPDRTANTAAQPVTSSAFAAKGHARMSSSCALGTAENDVEFFTPSAPTPSLAVGGAKTSRTKGSKQCSG
jgi:hypothetical protein